MFGLATDGNTVIYERAGSVNVNRWCGGVMLAFGALIQGLPARATRARAGD